MTTTSTYFGTYHDNGNPGLRNTGAAKGTAVEEMNSLAPLGELRRNGESTLGKKSRGGEKLHEANHLFLLLVDVQREEVNGSAGLDSWPRSGWDIRFKYI